LNGVCGSFKRGILQACQKGAFLRASGRGCQKRDFIFSQVEQLIDNTVDLRLGLGDPNTKTLTASKKSIQFNS
jgi:hypothetical protein